MNKLIRMLPRSVTKRINDTFIERLYNQYYIRRMSFTKRTFTTGCGEFSMNIPTHASDWYSNPHEPKLNVELCDKFSNNTVFYDVGSQFGYHIELALSCGVSPRNIHVFEVNKKRFEMLNLSYNSIGIELNNELVGATGDTDSLSIDQYSTHNDLPDIIKIDVEGAEGQVVNGMEEVLINADPIIYIEIHPQMLSELNDDPERIYNNLSKYGYQLQIINHRDPNSQWLSTDHHLSTETHLLKATSK